MLVNWKKKLFISDLKIKKQTVRFWKLENSFYSILFVIIYKKHENKEKIEIKTYINKKLMQAFKIKKRRFKWSSMLRKQCLGSLLINSLINFWDRVDFEVSLRLGLRFYRFNSLILFFCTLHIHFSTIKHSLAFVFKK